MRYSIFTIILFISISAFCQDSVKENPLYSIIKKNKKFHNYNIENFYLHTNKSIYFTGESVFFKAYVVNEHNNKPNSETTNLYINLYDFNNILVLSQLFYVENGKTYGSVKLPKDLKSGEYTLQLDTYWNKNFKKGSNFSILIQNLDDSKSVISDSKTIQDIGNSIITNNSTAQNSETETSGFQLTKSNSDNSDRINFTLLANKEAIANRENKFVYAALHKKGYITNTASFVLSEKFLMYSINFLKKDVLEGLNTISLFDSDNKLLAENRFYYKAEQHADILAKKINQTKDSLTLDLTLINIYKKANVSISIQHQDSKVIDYNSTITNVLLNENFNTPEQLTLNYNQQKNSFPYQSILDKTLLYDNERGLRIKGQLNTKLDNPSNYKITLYSKKDNILISKPLNEDRSFEFNNLFLTYPSQYSLTLTDENEKNKEGHFFIYNTFINYKADSILQKPLLKITKTTVLEKSNLPTKITDDIDLPISKNVELLDEVVLKNVGRKNDKRIKEILKENSYLGIKNGFSDYYLIDEDKDKTTLEQYLRNVRGLIVFSYFGDIYVMDRRDKTLVSIVIDGHPESQVGGFRLANDQVTNYELITYDITGVGSMFNNRLNLVSRKNLSGIKNKKVISKIYKTIKGYSFNQETLNDNSLIYPNKTSEHSFSTLDWIPDLALNPNTSNIISIKKPEHDNVKLIINGVSEDGDLIYKVIDL
ncbi:hypothetical protein [Olleya sp. YS]|uniref:hypothetical protein n=1 Tax=Olleya sp. YS TaxID=3028318 RepID=UPI0024343E62|nr:hypothetical protein [Olleya sp. YS]WGD34763.1 hypothetical protein Ollyesu_13355 [Olleya sp. YS]